MMTSSTLLLTGSHLHFSLPAVGPERLILVACFLSKALSTYKFPQIPPRRARVGRFVTVAVSAYCLLPSLTG